MSPVNQGGSKVTIHGTDTDTRNCVLGQQCNCQWWRGIGRDQDRVSERDTDENLNGLSKLTGLTAGLYNVTVAQELAHRFQLSRTRRGERVINTARNVERETEEGETVRGDEVQFNLHKLEEGNIYTFTLRGKKFGVEKLPSGDIRYHRLIEQNEDDE